MTRPRRRAATTASAVPPAITTTAAAITAISPAELPDEAGAAAGRAPGGCVRDGRGRGWAAARNCLPGGLASHRWYAACTGFGALAGTGYLATLSAPGIRRIPYP